MNDHVLQRRYRVLLASFKDSDIGQEWLRRRGASFSEILGAMHLNLSDDLAVMPDELHQEHVREWVTRLLPGRLGDSLSAPNEIPEIVLEFLLFLCREEGLARDWEWTTGVDQSRSEFEAAMANSARDRFMGPKTEPHRRPGSKLGRNDPCPCGSGKKYKKCCAKL